MSIPEKINAMRDRKQRTLGQFQSKLCVQEFPYPFGAVIQILLVVGEQTEIIAVPQVIPTSELVLHERIQFVQIQIAEPLACVVPDRDIRLSGEAIDDIVDQPERFRAFDLSAHDGGKNIVTHAWIELRDVAL